MAAPMTGTKMAAPISVAGTNMAADVVASVAGVVMTGSVVRGWY